MKPNPNNFCGGNFQDWLEVMLTPYCNGRCSWCIERDGFHPRNDIGCWGLSEKILKQAEKNILLLGGEPTMYPSIVNLVESLKGKNVYITTNGSNLAVVMFCDNLYGVNISVHHYMRLNNKSITGLDIWNQLQLIPILLKRGVKVRFNCNLIKGQIDSMEKVKNYIGFAKSLGVTEIRFAELKGNEDLFVDATKIFDGMPSDPFVGGCNQNFEMDGCNINVRLMCGLQTKCRAMPIEPEQRIKRVLYYNGHIYNGWMKELKLKKLLELVAEHKISVEDAEELFDKEEKIKYVPEPSDGGGCLY